MRRRPALLLLLLLLVATACKEMPAPVPTASPATELTTAPTTRELTIIYTNDEHGWMEGMEPGEGAANLAGLWQERAAPDETLVISGGDMWTGPAISTWFEGESMVEVMNEMGYAAAAMGNHEFDFGLEVLQARAFEADFPFVSANVRVKTDAEVPAGLAIEPYTIVERNGVQVGVIGLTTTSTPQTTLPTNVAAFEFIDYEQALREVLPEVRAADVDLVIVAGHLCGGELEALARQVADLKIALMGGGHCNELFAKEVSGTILVEGGYHFTSYATVSLTVDTASDAVLTATYETVANDGAAPDDAAVAAVVEEWQQEAEEELAVGVGYLEQPLSRRSEALEQLVVETWLEGYPAADVALTNRGGFRSGLPAGEVTFADVVGVLPFNNVLVDVELSGQQLFQVLAHSSAAVGGAKLGVGEWILEESGQAIEPEGTYHLLVNDFMYAGGDGYEMLARFDPDAYNTAVDWRQPVIDWILAQDSSATLPLDPAIARLVE